MKSIRIIPRLDIKGPNLVKGIHLEGLRVLGKPEEFARYYYENGADELIYMDVVASLFERNNLGDLISRTAKAIFIPLTVGGGLRTIEDILSVLRAGADKVCINTAAIKNPNFIRQASIKFGSSTIVVAIEAIKQSNGQYLCYIDNGREHTGQEAVDWAIRAEELGAGELLVTSVDKEGTGEGYDTDLIQEISKKVAIPVIAHGGCGDPNDVIDAVTIGGASGIAAASILHYHHILSGINPIETVAEEEGNTVFLRSRKIFNKIKPFSIQEIKKSLIQHNIDCRPFYEV